MRLKFELLSPPLARSPTVELITVDFVVSPPYKKKRFRSFKETRTHKARERREKMVGERVQDVASLSKESIPEEYIRSENEQPRMTTVQGEVLEVPTIDLREEQDEEKLLRKIVEASQQWGMFQIVNHEIPAELITKLRAVGKEFFELPQVEKEVYAKSLGSKSIEGYGTMLQKEVEGKKGWVDHLFHKIWPPSAIDYHFWPKNPPSYRFKTFFFFFTSIFFCLIVFIFLARTLAVQRNLSLLVHDKLFTYQELYVRRDARNINLTLLLKKRKAS